MKPRTLPTSAWPSGGEAPGRDRDRVAELRAEAIDEPAEQQQADGVRGLEGRVDQAVLRRWSSPSSSSSIGLISARICRSM